MNLSNGRIYDAYFSLGMALHTVMDSTSPVHQWRSYGIRKDYKYHGDNDKSLETLQMAQHPYYRSLTLDKMKQALTGSPDFCECGQ